MSLTVISFCLPRCLRKKAIQYLRQPSTSPYRTGVSSKRIKSKSGKKIQEVQNFSNIKPYVTPSESSFEIKRKELKAKKKRLQRSREISSIFASRNKKETPTTILSNHDSDEQNLKESLHRSSREQVRTRIRS